MSRTPRAWYRFDSQAADPTVAEIYVLDIIGDWIDELINEYYGFTATLTAKGFIEQLSKLDAGVKTIRVHINSPGGDVFAALNIANALRDQQTSKGRTVETVIDGLAASAASVIAMAGSVVRMADNALMMVHNPWSVSIGSAADMRKSAETLDTVRNTLVATYKWHSQLEADAIIALLDAETWMDATQALEHGFITDKVEGLAAAASINPRGIDALKVPEQFKARVAAYAKKPAPAPVPAAALDIVRACNAAGFPNLAEGFIQSAAPLETVTAKLGEAKADKAKIDARAADIRALCGTANLGELADGYIAGAMPVDAVRAHLVTIRAKASPAIDGTLPADPSTGAKPTNTLDARAIYRDRNKQ